MELNCHSFPSLKSKQEYELRLLTLGSRHELYQKTREINSACNFDPKIIENAMNLDPNSLRRLLEFICAVPKLEQEFFDKIHLTSAHLRMLEINLSSEGQSTEVQELLVEIFYEILSKSPVLAQFLLTPQFSIFLARSLQFRKDFRAAHSVLRLSKLLLKNGSVNDKNFSKLRIDSLVGMVAFFSEQMKVPLQGDQPLILFQEIYEIFSLVKNFEDRMVSRQIFDFLIALLDLAYQSEGSISQVLYCISKCLKNVEIHQLKPFSVTKLLGMIETDPFCEKHQSYYLHIVKKFLSFESIKLRKISGQLIKNNLDDPKREIAVLKLACARLKVYDLESNAVDFMCDRFLKDACIKSKRSPSFLSFLCRLSQKEDPEFRRVLFFKFMTADFFFTHFSSNWRNYEHELKLEFLKAINEYFSERKVSKVSEMSEKEYFVLEHLSDLQKEQNQQIYQICFDILSKHLTKKV